jgi:hypothetical protein
MPLGARGAGVSLDFVAPPENLFFQNERALAEVNATFAEIEKEEKIAAAERNFARLEEEAAEALEASRAAREMLAKAEETHATTSDRAEPKLRAKKAKGHAKKKEPKDAAATRARIPRMRPSDEGGSRVKTNPGQRELF